MSGPVNTVGIYLHIPFCVSKCYYCDFASYAVGNGAMQFEAYTNALVAEIHRHALKLSERDMAVNTVFIGGGTPTVLPPVFLYRLMEALRGFRFTEGIEYTVESNPGTLTDEVLRVLRDGGANRLSIGLQAWQDDLLKRIGRIHTRADFLSSLEAARRAGFENINADVMFGLPGQDVADYNETLENVARLGLEHISAYSLILEDGEHSCNQSRINRDELPDEETDRLLYEQTKKVLIAQGYEQYEISNFAKPGMECRHNIKYWQREQTLGLGLGAHSFMDGVRYHNSYDMEGYIAVNMQSDMRDDACDGLIRDAERVDDAEAMYEAVFLGLRMTQGIHKREFAKRYRREFDQVYGEKVQKLSGMGLIVNDSERVYLTDKGMDISNWVFSEL